MLSHLSIKNYATVESLEIEFQLGMSVITGETGAGKSIILGALGFTLGDRADKSIVRPGASRADIVAEFSISDIKSAQSCLADNDLILESDPFSMYAAQNSQSRRTLPRLYQWIPGNPDQSERFG